MQKVLKANQHQQQLDFMGKRPNRMKTNGSLPASVGLEKAPRGPYYVTDIYAALKEPIKPRTFETFEGPNDLLDVLPSGLSGFQSRTRNSFALGQQLRHRQLELYDYADPYAEGLNLSCEALLECSASLTQPPVAPVVTNSVEKQIDCDCQSSSDFEDGDDEEEFALEETSSDTRSNQTDLSGSDWMMKPSSALSFERLANSINPSLKSTRDAFNHMDSRVTPLSPMIGRTGANSDSAMSVAGQSDRGSNYGGTAQSTRESSESLMSLMTSTSGVTGSHSLVSPNKGAGQSCSASNVSSGSQHSIDGGYRGQYYPRRSVRTPSLQSSPPVPYILRKPMENFTITEDPLLKIRLLFTEEIQHLDTNGPFIGRQWLFHELYEILVKPQPPESGVGEIRAALIYGSIGTGKSATLYQLAVNSVFCKLTPITTAMVESDRHSITQNRQSPAQSVRTALSSSSGICLYETDSVGAAESPVPGWLKSGSSDSGIGRNITSHSRRSTRSASQGRRWDSSTSVPLSPTIEIENVRWAHLVSQQIVAFHFCQIDHNKTCLLPEFISNLCAMLANSPHLSVYKDFLMANMSVQEELTIAQCVANPVRSFRRGLVEPLKILRKSGKLQPAQNYLILVDGLDEAEFYCPEYGDSIGQFLRKYSPELPAWLKLVLTVKTAGIESFRGGFLCHKINLDNVMGDERIHQDAQDYIYHRICQSQTIQANISIGQTTSASHLHGSKSKLSQNDSTSIHSSTTSIPSLSANPSTRFIEHLSGVSKGNLLYLKLTLNLIQKNLLVMKSASYKVLPNNLTEVFLLMVNLKFPSSRHYERVLPIFNVSLASLYPLSPQELFEVVNSANLDQLVSWEEFNERLAVLDEFLLRKKTGKLVLFHPAFRDWLIRRDDGQSAKFLCDLRDGHALLSLRLSRNGERLDAEKTFELCHHILKAHIYRSIPPDQMCISPREAQAHWVAMSAADIRSALTYDRNIHFPNTKVSRLLLLAGADPNSRVKCGSVDSCPLLCVVAANGQQDLVNLLLEFGADASLGAANGMTPLMFASRSGQIDMVQLLHQHGANLAQLDQSNSCALVHAAQNGHVSLVSFLLQCDWSEETSGSSDADTSSNGITQESPLKRKAIQRAFVLAASGGHSQVCQFLLEFADAVIDECDPYGVETALTLACLNGRKEVVQLLLTQGAKCSYGTSRPKVLVPPLIQAVTNGSWELVSSLLNRGLDVDGERGSRGETSLMVASQYGHIGVMELLLSRDAHVNALNEQKRTPLFYACEFNQPPCAALLLDRGAQVDLADINGSTPLHLACRSGGEHLVRILLDRGASLDSVDNEGFRALEVAIKHQNVEALLCCLKKGAKLGVLTWKLADGHPVTMLMLLNKLLEDGNLLYKRNRLKESSQRYDYALRKFPTDFTAENKILFNDLQHNLLLNYARCKKRLQDLPSAIDLCTKAIGVKTNSFEGHYVRARCLRDNNQLDMAYRDITEAVRLCPADREARQVMAKLQQEVDQLGYAGGHRNAPLPAFNRAADERSDRRTDRCGNTSALSVWTAENIVDDNNSESNCLSPTSAGSVCSGRNGSTSGVSLQTIVERNGVRTITSPPPRPSKAGKSAYFRFARAAPKANVENCGSSTDSGNGPEIY